MWRSKYPLQKANKGCAGKCVLYLQAYGLPRMLSVALAHYKVSHRAELVPVGTLPNTCSLGQHSLKRRKEKSCDMYAQFILLQINDPILVKNHLQHKAYLSNSNSSGKMTNYY